MESPTPEGPWRAPRYAGSFEPFPYSVRDRTPLGRYVIERAYLGTPEGPSPYSVVHCKPCACVFVVVGTQALFVRQYRYAVGSWQDELVAGGVEPGESPRAAAVRELREETGFALEGSPAQGMAAAPPCPSDAASASRLAASAPAPAVAPESKLVDLGSFFPSAGSTDEIMYLFGVRLPEGTRPQATQFDRGERTERILMSRAEVERRMAEGSLVHAPLYVAWTRLQLKGLLDAWLPPAV